MTCEALEMCDSNGWPSSHSQYMCFFAIYLTLLATCRMTFADEFRRAFVAFLPWPVAMVVMYSRVYLGYHTTAQVLAGGTLGLMLGTGWFLLMNFVVSPWFPILEDSSLCQYLRIKDSSHIPDIIGFEYKNSREARNSSKSGNEKVSKDWRASWWLFFSFPLKWCKWWNGFRNISWVGEKEKDSLCTLELLARMTIVVEFQLL